MPETNNTALTTALLQIAEISKKDHARYEVQDVKYNELHNSMTTLSKNMAELVTEVRVIAVSNEHIEKRILKEVGEIRESQTKLVCRVDENDIKIKTIETKSAYKAGIDKGEDNVKKFWMDIRFKLTAALMSIVAVSVTLYKTFFTSGGS